MAIKIRSRKNKGARLQNKIREMLLEHYSELRDGDIKTAIMGESGRDIKLSPAAEDIIPFDVEAKNQEKINIWQSLQQAEDNKKDGRVPLLVFKRNHSKTYAVLELEGLLKFLKK